MCINFLIMHFYFKRKYGLYIMLFFDTKENNDENLDICLSVFLKRKKMSAAVAHYKINIVDVISHDMRLIRKIFLFKTLF